MMDIMMVSTYKEKRVCEYASCHCFGAVADEVGSPD